MSNISKTLANKPLIFVATLGVVYGDIGTSPLYAVKNCFELYGLPLDNINIMGIISLIFWSLLVVVSFKYIRLILRASNHGEGGILSLLTLCHGLGSPQARKIIFFLGIIGTSLFYGDGVITPAISVLGALEGLNVISPHHSEHIPIYASLILLALFLVQKHGSQAIGSYFGPVMILWFSVLAALGIYQISMTPSVLMALNPYYGVLFMMHNGLASLLTFGAIVLVVTGVEALYADLGHFNLRSIQTTWKYCVFPALALNYFGQGALLLSLPTAITNPFYMMAPDWALYPLLMLSTLATIIASQSIISGIFSISWQAMQLDFFPRMKIIHTSKDLEGQIYLPVVNYVLLISTLIAVGIFQSTDNLAAAYGIAITGIMMITSILACILAHYKWQWPTWKMLLVFTPIFALDALFFTSSMVKFFTGGWFPIVIAILLYTVIKSWKDGREILVHNREHDQDDLGPYLSKALSEFPTRIPGTAIFMSRSPNKAPSTLNIHLQHNKFLHEKVIFLSIITKKKPKVPDSDRYEIIDYGNNMYHVVAYFGFIEKPDVHAILSKVKEHGIHFEDAEVTFFLSRGIPIPASELYLTGIHENLFIFLSHNSANATDYFQIPYEQVVEYGVRFEV